MAKVYLFLRCYLMSYPLSGVRTKVERRTFSNVRILINCGSFRSSASSWGWRQEGKSLSRRLLSLLDLKDWKRKQMANVPLIILGDSLPTSEALSTLHGRKGSCLLSSFPTYLSWVRKGSLPHSGELFLLEPAHRISFGIQPFPTILWELGITCFILWMSLLRIPLNMDLYMRGSKISSFLMRGMVLTPPRDLKRFFFYYPSS